MKMRKEGTMYYASAALSVVVVLYYIASGSISPLVGFMIAAILTFVLYPSKSIALLSGVVVSAALKFSGRMGMEGMENSESPVKAPVKAPVQDSDENDPVPASASDSAPAPVPTSTGTSGPSAPAPSVPSGTSPVPVSVAAPAPYVPKVNRVSTSNPETSYTPAVMPAPASNKPDGVQKSGFVGSQLTPSDYKGGTGDMQQLSDMLDKTMALVQMLPDDFLKNKNNY